MTHETTVALVGAHGDAVVSALTGLDRGAVSVRSVVDGDEWELSDLGDVDVVVVHEEALADRATTLDDLSRTAPGRAVVRIGDPEAADAVAAVTGSRVNGTDASRHAAAVTRIVAALESRHAVAAEGAVSGLTAAFGDAPSDTREDVCRRVVETVVDGFALPYAMVAVLDEDAGLLDPMALSPAMAAEWDDSRPLGPELPHVWRTFIKGETTRFAIGAEPAVDGPLSPAACGLAVPVGENGVLIAGTGAATTITDSTVEAVELLATTARLALDRVRFERDRREARRQLDRQTDRLERVVHINDKVRKMDQALVRAETRPEIERIVCERLMTSDRFAFAWIGELDDDGTGMRVRSMAGDEGGYLDSAPLTFEGDEECEPAPRTLQAGEITIVERVTEGLHEATWREEALLRDFLSVASVPLVYGDVTYGVVTVYASEPAAFDDLAVSVLTEMGETIGYAIDAAERRAALTSESVTELKLELAAPDDVFTRLSREFDARVDVKSLASRSDTEAVVYVTLPDVPADPVVEWLSTSVTVEHARALDRPDAHVECVVAGTSLPGRVAGFGATPRSIRADGDRVRLAATLAEKADVRTFLDRFSSAYRGVAVLAQRTRETRGDARPTTAGADLTDRQREVYEAAYHGGYFEWPREQTGEELAATLGISQPAFLQHLRACEKKFARAFCDGDREGRPSARR